MHVCTNTYYAWYLHRPCVYDIVCILRVKRGFGTAFISCLLSGDNALPLWFVVINPLIWLLKCVWDLGTWPWEPSKNGRLTCPEGTHPIDPRSRDVTNYRGLYSGAYERMLTFGINFVFWQVHSECHSVWISKFERKRKTFSYSQVNKQDRIVLARIYTRGMHFPPQNKMTS